MPFPGGDARFPPQLTGETDMSEKKRPWWQYLLAVVGAGYLVAGAAWGVHALAKRPAGPRGPSEIAAHPERAGEIMARERAEEMKQRLGLSDEQTAKIAELLKADADGPPGPASMRAVMEKIREVLTPEQREKMGGGPGALGPPPGMRGGPGQRVTPERMEALNEHMTPEQRQKFDAGMKRMQERRGAMRGRFGGGPGGMPPGPPPGPPPGGMPPGPPPGEGPPPPPMP